MSNACLIKCLTGGGWVWVVIFKFSNFQIFAFLKEKGIVKEEPPCIILVSIVMFLRHDDSHKNDTQCTR